MGSGTPSLAIPFFYFYYTTQYAKSQSFAYTHPASVSKGFAPLPAGTVLTLKTRSA